MKAIKLIGILMIASIIMMKTPLNVLASCYGFIGPALRFEVSVPNEVKIGNSFTLDLTFTVANYDLYNATIEISIKGAGILRNVKLIQSSFIPAGNFTVLSLALTPTREGIIMLGIIASYDYFRGNVSNHESAVLWIEVTSAVARLRNELLNEISQLSSETQMLKSELISLNSSYTKLLRENEKLKNEYSILEENITKLKESYDELMKDYEVVSSKLSVLEESISGTQSAMYTFMALTVILTGATGFLLAALLSDKLRKALKIS